MIISQQDAWYNKHKDKSLQTIWILDKSVLSFHKGKLSFRQEPSFTLGMDIFSFYFESSLWSFVTLLLQNPLYKSVPSPLIVYKSYIMVLPKSFNI